MFPAPPSVQNKHLDPSEQAGAEGQSRSNLSQVSLLGPVFMVVLGGVLGASTQMSTGAQISLRVPALFAALLMVAQGLLELERNRRQIARAERSAPIVTPSGEVVQVSRADYLPSSVSAPPGPQHAALPTTLMGLAGWLGLAVLVTGGSAVTLSVLASVPAFMLFAMGWQAMLGPH